MLAVHISCCTRSIHPSFWRVLHHGNITAKLHSKGLWIFVNNKKKCPITSADQEKWELDQEMAAGLIASTLEAGQHVHVQGLEDDPVKMWEALHNVHVQKQAGTRFNAYDVLFNIRKEPDETLHSLISHVTTAMRLCQNPRPSDGSYTLEKQDEELVVMTLI